MAEIWALLKPVFDRYIASSGRQRVEIEVEWIRDGRTMVARGLPSATIGPPTPDGSSLNLSVALKTADPERSHEYRRMDLAAHWFDKKGSASVTEGSVTVQLDPVDVVSSETATRKWPDGQMIVVTVIKPGEIDVGQATKEKGPVITPTNPRDGRLPHGR